MKTSISSARAGKIDVAGELTFATVRSVLRDSEQAIGTARELEFDLSAVTSADSAGLALLIEWYRLAAQRGGRAKFTAVPAQVAALAKISDVDKLLGLSS